MIFEYFWVILIFTVLVWWFSGTLPDSTPSPILLPVLTRALLGYSLGSHLSRYSPKPFLGTRPDYTFLWYSPIFPLFRHSPRFYPFSDPSPGTHPGPSLILARILPFPILARTFLGYSPGFHLSLVLTQISTFPTLTWILPFPDTRLDFYFSVTRPDSTFSRYSPEPFSSTRPDFYFSGTRLDSTLSRYSPRPFSGTRLDSIFL